ncbi:MAG: discoidin domain-containing protein, partial [Bacteroidota bacterium]|nr:discoidin domain-containing protein [Bacteroidota bacterium]
EENDFWGSGGNQRETDNWYSGAGAYPMNKEDQPFFDASVKSDLKEMIRIHRNHPSIIVWSMCNEPFFTGGGTIERVRSFLKELTQLTHELDPSRAVGIGGCQRGDIDKIGDVAGYNGDGARLFMNPAIPNVVTEYGSTIAKRPGKYIPGWGDLQKEKYPWRSGEAIWCAFDYGTRAGDFGLMGMVDYFRLPKNQWYWYRNEYKHIVPPEAAVEGIPARLKLESDKKIISETNGTDDAFLVVSVLDKDGKQLSNSPDVTLKIISGPGEFPTGRSITFSNTSDIYIRDGKAAIEFRSYFGGKTVIKATSAGLQSDLITIETKGLPRYVEGVSPKVADRPYVRYTAPKPTSDNAVVNIAFQKPTRAGSEADGQTANRANDKDPTTCWLSSLNEAEKWWQVDLENIYTVSEVRILFSTANFDAYKIELSKDNQNWESLAVQNDSNGEDRNRKHAITSKASGRFLRITFTGAGKPASINEVEVYGKPVN